MREILDNKDSYYWLADVPMNHARKVSFVRLLNTKHLTSAVGWQMCLD